MNRLSNEKKNFFKNFSLAMKDIKQMNEKRKERRKKERKKEREIKIIKILWEKKERKKE